MKLFVLILALTLAGCHSTEPSATIGENAKEQINIAYSSLPKECKTKVTEKQFKLAQDEIDAIIASCEKEKEPLIEKIRYQRVLLAGLSGLFLLLCVWLLRKTLGF